MAAYLEWDDFTGGYHVGPGHATQPPNTFRGTDVYVDPNDGMLNTLEDWDIVSFNGGTSPTAPLAAGTWQSAWTDGLDLFLIYMVAGNLLNFAKYDMPSPATVTNYTQGNAQTLLATEAWTGTFIFASYTPSAGVANLARFNTATGAITTYTTPENLRYLARWGEFMVGAGVTTKYRLFYSAAYDPTSWAGDYIDIGDASPITALVPFNDTLYVGKTDGWWAVTGVPGAGAVVRNVGEFPGPNGWELGPYGGPGLAPIANAVATPFGVMFTSTALDVTAAMMNGGVPYPVNYADPGVGASAEVFGTNLIYPVTPGQFFLVPNRNGPTNGAEMISWWCNMTLGAPRWAKIEMPYVANGGIIEPTPVAKYLPGAPIRGRITMFSGADNVTPYYRTFAPSADIVQDAITGVVHLCERRRAKPFRVTALYVETCWLASASATPAITGRVEMRGWPDLAPPGRQAGTSISVSPTVVTSGPTTALYHDDRFVYATTRFGVDAPIGTGVVPIITFSECRIRRVWAEIQEAE